MKKQLLSIFVVGITAALALPSFAQMSGGGGELQQKLAAVKQSIAANQQRLHHYQWVETQQLTLKGDAKPAKQQLCSYGPNGQVQKVPIGQPPPQQQQSGRQRRLKEHVVEKKTEEMQDYMGQVKSILALYVPPDPQRMEKAFKAGNASLNPGGSGVAQLVFKNYAQPGDQMTVSFDTAAKKVQQVNVNTYLDEPKDVVTLSLQFASLPDGTNYVQQSVLNATAKQLQVTTTNSDYSKLAQ
jgi:type II secretory pathway pseudopilin PulG